MTDIWIFYSTFPKREEALSVARMLIEERLIACANVVDGVTSIYRWEGQVQEDSEVVLIGKTQGQLVDTVTARIRSLHSYDVPCVTAWKLEKGHADFLQWVAQETNAQ